MQWTTIPAGEYAVLSITEQPLRRQCAAGNVTGAIRLGAARGGLWLVPAKQYIAWAMAPRRMGRPRKPA